MRRVGVVPITLALAFALGCRAQPEPEVSDVRALLGSSQVWTDTQLVDFGTPEASPYLREGWSGDENAFVWSVGNRAALRLFIGTPGPRTLVARLAPLSWPGAPAQSLVLSIDGHEFAREVLEPGIAEHRWVLPVELVPPGMRRIDIVYGRADRPADVLAGSSDGRRLAVAWYELRVEGAGETPGPAIIDHAGNPMLRIARGTSISFYAQAEPPASVELEVIAPQEGDASLPVRVQIEGDHAGLLWKEELAPGTPQRVPLYLASTDTLRIVVDTSGASGAESGESVDLHLALRGRRVVAAGSFPAFATPLVSPAVASGPPASGIRSTPNVLIFLVDCLRADHLGAYGYPRATSPEIDRFAADATVFLDAQAASSWTRTTVTSIFTGLMPEEHGVKGPKDALAPGFETLAEQLQAAGYQTGAIFTNGNIGSDFGLGQGFATYLHLKEDERRPTHHVGADVVIAKAKRWLDGRDPARPFFLYLHATDPHGPYVPPEPFASRFAPEVRDPVVGSLALLADLNEARIPDPGRFRKPLIDLYDGEIAFTDAQFGHLIEDLRERGDLDDTLIVVVADHGEEFYDHGWWEHGKTLFVEQLHVPLVIRFPHGAGAGRRIDTPVHQLDLLPTVLGAAGQRPAASLAGLDLSTLLAEDKSAPERVLGAELDRDGRRIHALLAERWKFVRYRSGAGPEGRAPRLMLFDRSEDAREQHNLYFDRPVLAGFFRLALDAQLAALPPTPTPPTAHLDAETEANLRALGYVQ